MKKQVLENPGMHQQAKPEIFRFAQHHRENPTQAEEALWEALKSKKLEGHKFRRQHPLGAYILDFYCHAAKLSIEVDGGYHFTKEQSAYDKRRTMDLASIGIRELRVTNEQVMDEIEKVLDFILENLRMNDAPVRLAGAPYP